MDMIKKNLSHPLFELVSDPEKADILWFFDHFKDFKLVMIFYVLQ